MPLFRTILFIVSVLATSAFSMPIAQQKPLNCLGPFEKPLPWQKRISFTETELALRNDKITDITPLQPVLEKEGKTFDGSTVGISMVVYASGVRAVFKPGMWNAESEVAAYKLARLLRLRLIPPTVMREINGVVGSLQFFVDSPFDLKAATTEAEKLERFRIWSLVSQRQKNDRDAYMYIFGQWDRHWGNLIIDNSYSIAMIDNATIRWRQRVRWGETPYVKRIDLAKQLPAFSSKKPFDFDHASALSNPSKQEFIDLFGQYADAKGFNGYCNYLWSRTFISDFSMRVVLWDNGIWIRPLGYHQYGALMPKRLSAATKENLKALTFENIRAIVPKSYNDKWIQEAIERRDDVLAHQ